MVDFAKVVDGVIVEGPVQLPKNYEHTDGTRISNFDKLDYASLVSYGYYPVSDARAPIDDRIEYYDQETLYFNGAGVDLSAVVVTYSIDQLKIDRINEAYEIANSKLDEQAEGYSKIQIAAWSLIQAEVIEFNSSGTIGPTMQQSMAESELTAQELSDLITPKIATKNAIFVSRNTHKNAINALTTALEVVDYDLSVGW